MELMDQIALKKFHDDISKELQMLQGTTVPMIQVMITLLKKKGLITNEEINQEFKDLYERANDPKNGGVQPEDDGSPGNSSGPE